LLVYDTDGNPHVGCTNNMPPADDISFLHTMSYMQCYYSAVVILSVCRCVCPSVYLSQLWARSNHLQTFRVFRTKHVILVYSEQRFW